MRRCIATNLLVLFLLFSWVPDIVRSQGVFDLQPNRDRREGLSAIQDCITTHGFANTATIKPNGDENIIEVDITNVWDITITGVMVVPLGPLAEEHFSGSWFVFEFDPLFLRPNEVRTHSHSFQGLTHAFPEEVEIEIAVVNVRNMRPRWVLADFDSPWPFTTQDERFQIAERIFCRSGTF